MKRKLLIFALCMVFLTVSVAGSLAYFSEESSIVHNIITTGSIRIDLIEKDGSGNDFQEVKDALPGCSYGKVVTVKNIGNNPAFVRVQVEKSITLPDGTAGDSSLVSIDFNDTDWELKDGYYYYNGAVEPGKETSVPLFTEVTLASGMGNSYQGCTINIVVSAQAVQTANNAARALEAAGWPTV